MYPLTDEIPKTMMPVGNVPLIHYQLEILEQNGFSGLTFP
jgi:NDP-sugar pyrophosphorylase family protein